MPRPTLVLFDVNGTLSNLDPLRRQFEQVGAPPDLLETWFATTLRDGFALTAAGGYAEFRSVAVAVLRGRLAKVPRIECEPAEAAERIVAGLGELALHADVEEGLRTLRMPGCALPL